MFYIPKIGNYSKILPGQEVKDFVARNFGKYFKSAREQLYSKLNEEENLRIIANLLYTFLTTTGEVEKYAKMISQILLITVYIATILRSWIYLIQNYNWLTVNQWLKTN